MTWPLHLRGTVLAGDVGALRRPRTIVLDGCVVSGRSLEP